jgi:two-component system, LytTR family, sensor kinase
VAGDGGGRRAAGGGCGRWAGADGGGPPRGGLPASMGFLAVLAGISEINGENLDFCTMTKQYNSKAGAIFALSIAVMATVLPRVIRFDVEEPRTVALNFAYLSAMLFFYWLVHHFFLLKLTSGVASHRFIRPVISILCGVLIVSVIVHLLHIASPFPVNRDPAVEIRQRQVYFIRVFRGAIISAFTYFAVFYYRLLLMLQHSKLENEYLKQENLQAQLTSLRQQISPHFLFNSLNTLSTLSHEEAVKEYILKMSEVYRYVLHYQEKSEVPVQEEIAFINAYIYILKSRFEEGLDIDIRVRPDQLSRKILPFSLQLLVENAIKHNSISYKVPLGIAIYDLNERLVVENDLRLRTTVYGDSGTGLHNLAKRYRLSGGKDIVITRTNSTFKVEIPFLL